MTKYRRRHFVTDCNSSLPLWRHLAPNPFSFNGLWPSVIRAQSLASAVLHQRQWRWTSQQVLRISFEENSNAIVIKLEGRIAGPWATELGRLWEEKSPAVAHKKLSLDLRATTYADAGGIKVLRAIYSQTEASILTGTPWTEYLAEEVARKNSQPADTES